MSASDARRSVADYARAMRNPDDRLFRLTDTIARALWDVQEQPVSPPHSWDWAREHDQWLAVGFWRSAEAVVKALPLKVQVPL